MATSSCITGLLDPPVGVVYDEAKQRAGAGVVEGKGRCRSFVCQDQETLLASLSMSREQGCEPVERYGRFLEQVDQLAFVSDQQNFVVLTFYSVYPPVESREHQNGTKKKFILTVI
jgi:hypothetical protein